jgi:hypothetical protein
MANEENEIEYDFNNLQTNLLIFLESDNIPEDVSSILKESHVALSKQNSIITVILK